MGLCAGELPGWVGGEFKEITIAKKAVTIAFRDTGLRFSGVHYPAQGAPESFASEYGSKIEIAAGGGLSLQERAIRYQIRYLPVAAEAAEIEPKSLCSMLASDRNRLSLPVPAVVVFRTEDARSAGRGLREQRAVIVPLEGLSAEAIAQTEAQLQQRFAAKPTRSEKFLYVACETVRNQ